MWIIFYTADFSIEWFVFSSHGFVSFSHSLDSLWCLLIVLVSVGYLSLTYGIFFVDVLYLYIVKLINNSYGTSKYKAYSVFSKTSIIFASRSLSGIEFCKECKIQSYFYSEVQNLFSKVHSFFTHWFEISFIMY